jgi:hypothetical protein
MPVPKTTAVSAATEIATKLTMLFIGAILLLIVVAKPYAARVTSRLKN